MSVELSPNPPAAAERDLSDDPRWQAVLRVIASRGFVKAPRLSRFLSYVAERAIRNRLNEVTEQQIGFQVFHREAGYDPAEDNVVRATARLLRERLARYYAEQGGTETIRISIPRGAYVPVFDERPVPPRQLPEREPETLPAPEVPPAPSNVWKAIALFAAGAAFAALCFGIQQWLARENEPAPSRAGARLWQALFTKDRRTLLVPGDAGLNIFIGLSGHQVALDDYLSGKYLDSPFAKTPKPYTYSALALRRYTSFPDLKIAMNLARIVPPGSRLELRYARDFRLDDFHDANVILLGQPPFNPWTELFKDALDFRLEWDGANSLFTLWNRHPQPGEQSSYIWREADKRGYGLLTFTDNPREQGKVLILQGTTIVGVEGAGNLLFDEARLAPVINRVSSGVGTIHNFELLLEVNFLNGRSSNDKILAIHVH